MTELDPLALAIKALNEIPKTRFRNPVGPYNDTEELAAYLAEVKRYSNEMIEASVHGRKVISSHKGYMYFAPTP